MVRLPKHHIWTTENIKRLSNLSTFLVQLSQLLLVLYLQLGQFLQLSIIPCAIMSWAANGQRRRKCPKLESGCFCAFARVQTLPPLDALYTRDRGDL